MKNWKRNCSATVVLLSLAGCAGLAPTSGYNPTPFWTIQMSAFADFKPGVATKAEVRQKIGIPVSETSFERLNEEVWEYRCLNGPTEVLLAYVHFDPNGVLKSIQHELDTPYNGGVNE